jgi:hypothetical protein
MNKVRIKHIKKFKDDTDIINSSLTNLKKENLNASSLQEVISSGPGNGLSIEGVSNKATEKRTGNRRSGRSERSELEITAQQNA